MSTKKDLLVELAAEGGMIGFGLFDFPQFVEQLQTLKKNPEILIDSDTMSYYYQHWSIDQWVGILALYDEEKYGYLLTGAARYLERLYNIDEDEILKRIHGVRKK